MLDHDQTDYDSAYDDIDDHRRAYSACVEGFNNDWVDVEHMVNQVLYRIENDSVPDLSSWIGGDDFPDKTKLLKMIIAQLVKEVENG